MPQQWWRCKKPSPRQRTKLRTFESNEAELKISVWPRGHHRKAVAAILGVPTEQTHEAHGSPLMVKTQSRSLFVLDQHPASEEEVPTSV